MPNLKASSYQRPRRLFSANLETIIPSAIRKIDGLQSKDRIKIDTPDDDFLIVDQYLMGSQKALIISHGLEGSSDRPYVLGMVRRFAKAGWDVFAWNYRGCGGEMNRTAKMYHSGASEDLDEMVKYVKGKGYEKLSLLGFSLGANKTLKYLGEANRRGLVSSAVVISAPLDLAGCSNEIDHPKNSFYANRFLKSLTEKIIQKKQQIPEILPDLAKMSFSSLHQFDDLVTAPLHGFNSARHYYEVSSSRNFINYIDVPTLVINAANDPFLSKTSLDSSYFETSEYVFFEMPKFGGHVGFSTYGHQQVFWSEERALRFITLQELL